jgi:hypothetical protein
LAVLVGNLKQIAPRTEHRVLPKLISDLRDREGRDLSLHEALYSANAILQRFIDGMVKTGTHSEPSRDAKSRHATSKNQEIPGGQTESNRPDSQNPSSSRSA